MSKQFPIEFRSAWGQAGVKAAFVLEQTPRDGNMDCKNCGGYGFMSSFVATNGPFPNAGAPGKVSHYHDGSWWVGEAITAECPVCKGKQSAPPEPEEPDMERGYRHPVQMSDMLRRKDWE